MKTTYTILCSVACFGLTGALFAQTGPFDPETWPATVNPNLPVHYVVTDGGLEPPGASWDATAESKLFFFEPAGRLSA